MGEDEKKEEGKEGKAASSPPPLLLFRLFLLLCWPPVQIGIGRTLLLWGLWPRPPTHHIGRRAEGRRGQKGKGERESDGKEEVEEEVEAATSTVDDHGNDGGG
jgi:hypothetical protein